MLQNDEATLLYLADAAVADKSHRYKHTAADIPNSWVLIDIKGFLPEVPWLPPSAIERMCFVSVMHPFLCLTEANNGLVLILNIMEYYGLAADILGTDIPLNGRSCSIQGYRLRHPNQEMQDYIMCKLSFNLE